MRRSTLASLYWASFRSRARGFFVRSEMSGQRKNRLVLPKCEDSQQFFLSAPNHSFSTSRPRSNTLSGSRKDGGRRSNWNRSTRAL